MRRSINFCRHTDGIARLRLAQYIRSPVRVVVDGFHITHCITETVIVDILGMSGIARPHKKVWISAAIR